MTGCTSGGYDQFETSPEAIEQELRPAVCERRQTDLRQIIVYITESERCVFILPVYDGMHSTWECVLACM